ncbi:MAG: DUF2339 domain-containing protein [Anderseniella sp.]|jgi:uncharacterized membrane protein|nr:DUF2339 domain-containing protein [Anderseniella sp.]
MDEWVWIVLIAASVFFLPLILAIVALNKAERVARELFKLRNELNLLKAQAIQPPEPAAAAPALEQQAEAAPETETVSAAAPEPEAIAAPEPPREAARASLEENLAGRWFVWIGAVAIALAGLFLVKYMADYGLLGPGMRVMLGLAAGVALTLGGEWLRRRPTQQTAASLKPDYVPQALSAGGLAAVFASIYAASALYGFIGPAATLAGLGATALAAFALSVVQGPLTAIVGLLGGFALPALLESAEPFAPGLFGYFAVILIAVMAVMVWRQVLWLAMSAIAASAAWVLIWLAGPFERPDTLTLGLFVTLLGAGFAVAGSQISRDPLPAAWHKPLGGGGAAMNAAIVAGLTASALMLLLASRDGFGHWSVVSLAVFAVALCAAAMRAQRFDFLGLVASITVVLFFAGWGARLHIEGWLGDWLVPDTSPWAAQAPEETSAFLRYAAGFGVAAATAGYVLLWRSVRPWIWATVAAFTPLGLMAAAYATLRSLEPSLTWSFAGLGLAALFVGMAARLRTVADEDEAPRLALGIVAVAVCAAVAMALAFVLRDAWLSASLAALVAATGYVSRHLSLPQLRWPALVMAGVVLFRLTLNHHILDYDEEAWLGRWWVIYGYGLPLAMFHLALKAFGDDDSRDDLLTRVLEGGRIALAAMLVSAMIRVGVAGSLEADRFTLLEAGLHATSWLVSAAACWRRYGQRGGFVDLWAGRVLTAMGAGLVGLCLFSGLNPLLDRQMVGNWPLVNALAPAYLLPALLLAIIGYLLRDMAMPRVLRQAGPPVVLALLLAWLSFEVRRWFHAPDMMHLGAVSTAENYTYSAVWLLFALALLAGGILLQAAPLRYAALAVLVLSVLKVFLVDLSDLEGLLRVASFLGLGLCLVGIGFIYQRFVYRPVEDGSN